MPLRDIPKKKQPRERLEARKKELGEGGRRGKVFPSPPGRHETYGGRHTKRALICFVPSTS